MTCGRLVAGVVLCMCVDDRGVGAPVGERSRFPAWGPGRGRLCAWLPIESGQNSSLCGARWGVPRACGPSGARPVTARVFALGKVIYWLLSEVGKGFMTNDDRPFSERYGYVRKTIQVKSMDGALKNGLWNAFSRHVWIDHPTWDETSSLERFCKKLWVEHYNKTEDDFRDESRCSLGIKWSFVRYRIKQRFNDSNWREVYDFLEFVGNHAPYRLGSFIKECNLVFERESAGYRFVNGLITPIMNELEIEAIESAIKQGGEPATHLFRALESLSDRQAPDCSNSMKDSILAVESQARITMGDPTATLGKLLVRLQKERGLPTSLKTVIEVLHGYTSSPVRIRHGLVGTEKDVNFQMAKFVLVVCSACVVAPV